MIKKECFFCLLLLCSCSEKEEQPKQVNWNMEKSTEMNKELAIEQDLDIDLYFARHENWEVKQTGTGLRYVIFKKTNGAIPKPGMEAKTQYRITLLDGREVYKTEADEFDIFRIDKSDMESGIHEGIKLMHVGEKAKLVFPSHLAHGLVGDLDKIPPLSPLVVDIELIGIE
ncbi:FKBP-type peptidyl-prolyl cis-trans isomerase [Fluviicola sp.]|jgi:FKBP-type peptidyl-prolyl cis-trans isomerase|uniref:FKBP-type peptidyl-prolyl cis-trans isomerase n=1 Tax=Fluviicola sp. TaxID=1917219 RepID=UPI0028251CBF|nr:FKBP-type peptidyl-prolyl cis-trans isomerase [Fluviicola sp.]MDR0801231.1 FKBP-type peptidyl-prolyl cis-trans isomerase [Fluviicola sp.]